MSVPPLPRRPPHLVRALLPAPATTPTMLAGQAMQGALLMKQLTQLLATIRISLTMPAAASTITGATAQTAAGTPTRAAILTQIAGLEPTFRTHIASLEAIAAGLRALK
jgi:hypothetical protein